jgi:hypothetical protein
LIVRTRVSPYCRDAHRAALRDSAPSLAFLVSTACVLLPLALFIIDTTPHMGPAVPASVSLTVAAVLAVTAQGIAIGFRYRGYLRTRRRVQGCGRAAGHSGANVVFDLPRPGPRHGVTPGEACLRQDSNLRPRD